MKDEIKKQDDGTVIVGDGKYVHDSVCGIINDARELGYELEFIQSVLSEKDGCKKLEKLIEEKSAEAKEV